MQRFMQALVESPSEPYAGISFVYVTIFVSWCGLLWYPVVDIALPFGFVLFKLHPQAVGGGAQCPGDAILPIETNTFRDEKELCEETSL